jgi:hypothetical protein
VQIYNFKTVLLGPKIKGAYVYTYPKTTINGVQYGLIGIDASGNDLYTNNVYLSPDRCKAITSFPTLP